MTPTYRYKATVTRVIDGDTLDLTIDLGFGVAVRQHIRVANLYAPEAKTPEGQAVTAWLRELLTFYPDLVVETTKTKSGTDVQTFARYVATVWLNGRPLQDWYTEAGFLPGGLGLKEPK